LADLQMHYASAAPPKGEIVILVGPPPVAAATDEAIDAALRTALATASLRDAVATVATDLGAPRRRVYARALLLSGNQP
jgi:16S rRNA (cytidine1402-2'-O)-methyltransferase